MADLLQTVDNYRRRLDSLNAEAVARLVATYQASWRRLEAQLMALMLEIGDNPPTQGQLMRLERYRLLMTQIEQELLGLQVLTGNEIELAADQAVDLAMTAVGDMLGQVGVGFNALPKNAVKSLLGFLDPSGPLYARLRELAGTTAAGVADMMLQGITLGWNPRKIARMVQRAFAGGLSDAMRFVRTAQLWAYRAANQAQFQANADVVTGWVWRCALDERACMSCIAMHGTVHSSDEILNDHHNGRCAMVPLVAGFDSPITQTGEDWFSNLSESEQRRRMGAQYYDAWRGGAFNLADLSEERDNDVYGPMRAVAPLWRLLGAEPPVRMR